jgi:hypothetical protein
MSDVGQRERPVQDRVVLLFADRLGYRYLGNRHYRPGNSNIEQEDLRAWLRKQGTSETLITRALHRLKGAAAVGEGKTLYEANREVYGLLRYGVKVREAGRGAEPDRPAHRLGEASEQRLRRRRGGDGTREPDQAPGRGPLRQRDRLVELAGRVQEPSEAGAYPTSMDTPAKRALYDNLDGDENVAVRIDTAVRHTRKDDWRGNRFKEREVFRAVHEELGEYETRADEIFEIFKSQREY